MAAGLQVQFEDQVIRSENIRLTRMLIAAGAIIVLLAFAVAVLIFRPRQPPYVVMVDEKGEPLAIAHPVIGTQSLDTPVVEWALADFIHNARTVTGNLDEQKHYLDRVYAFVAGQAAKTITDYYRPDEQNPLQLGAKGWTEVRVLRCLKEPAANTYQVDWEETAHENAGSSIKTTRWRADLGVTTATPKREDADLNPIGLYITTLSWAPEAQQ
jgi:type IV secretion system protein VirB5